MKKLLPVLSWVGMGLAVLLMVFVFVVQLQTKQKLTKELKAKKAELREAETASRKMEELERKSQGLRQKEIKMKRRVVVGDTQPLELIKTITGLASKMGLRKIRFELKMSSQIVQSAPAAPPGSGPIPAYFQMNFDSTFPQALKFISGLNELERVVTVEKIDISRKTDILPYQSISLSLVTYSFSQ
jgi:Tfp pilus assembly protein PilO